ncbi:MAG: Nif3-like dinuclear metal center hexameric protein [Saprospiraceae bacterium]
MKIQDVIQFLDGIAPLEWQENYDNAGLIVGNDQWKCTGIMVCLDSTELIVDEAIANHCNLIIAHHPIIFSGLKKINGHHYVDKAIIKAIKNDVAIFAIHTNLDNAYWNGVNGKIADKINITNTQILQPKNFEGLNGEVIGAGLIGLLNQPIPIMEFLQKLKDKMELNTLKYTTPIKDFVHSIALCGGSGSFLIQQAIQQNADVFITSDLKYHEFFESNEQIVLVDIGHYESEKYTIELLYTILQNNFSNFALHFTKHTTNPVHYL